MAISFKLPQLEQDPILLAETRTSKINAFINDLHFSDPVKAASELIEELQIMNTQKVAYANRLNALEVYRPVVDQLSEALIPLFNFASLPLSRNQSAFAETAKQLWEELAYGYKWALIDLQNKIINIKSDKSTALVVARGIHALNQITYITYLTYKSTPKQYWSEIYQLYYCSLTQNAQRITINDELVEDNETSVDSVFIEGLLLALANPNRLSGPDIVRARDYIANLTSLAKFSAIGPVESSAGVFLIELDSDKRPASFSMKRKETDEVTDLLLHTVGVAERIHKHLRAVKNQRLPSDKSLPDNAIAAHYEDLLFHLISHFGKPPVRSFSRARKNDGMELGVGINNAHYFAPKIGNDYKNLVVQSAAIKPSRWQILNVGAGGYALRKFNSSQVSMHVGDIAAIKNNTTLEWELGVIRWVSINELNQLDIGFELISPTVKAVSLISAKEKTQEKGLLLPQLPALKQEASIIVPRGAFEPDTPLEMVDEDTTSKIIIKKLVERTFSFERYQFSLI